MLNTGLYDAEAMEGADGGATWQRELLLLAGRPDLGPDLDLDPPHAPHGEEALYGLTSCVFESTRPFHPARYGIWGVWGVQVGRRLGSRSRYGSGSILHAPCLHVMTRSAPPPRSIPTGSQI